MQKPLAKEVIVAMLSDLDRTRQPDIPHAVPVAYGLSGYGLKTEVMRNIILHVIQECERKSLRVDVVSTDGQFCKLATRSHSNLLLTLLQLQKDVWEECRKVFRKVTQFCNFKPLQSYAQLQETVDFEKRYHGKDQNGATKCQIIVSGRKGKSKEIILMPKNINDIVQIGYRKTFNERKREETIGSNVNILERAYSAGCY